MTELKDVVEAILIDLIEARHKANQYSQAVSSEYVDEGDLVNFSAPAVDIGNVKVDIKFAMSDAPSPAAPVFRLSKDRLMPALDSAAQETLKRPTLKLKETSDTEAGKAAVSKALAEAVMENTDPTTLKVDRTKAMTAATKVLNPHLGTTSSGRTVSSRVVKPALDSMIISAEQQIQIVREQVQKEQPRRPQMIVDADRLKEVGPDMIGTLSLDLDLTSMDWSQVDDE